MVKSTPSPGSEASKKTKGNAVAPYSLDAALDEQNISHNAGRNNSMDYRNRGDRTNVPLMMDRTVESEQKWTRIPPPSLNELVPPETANTAMKDKAQTSNNSDYTQKVGSD